MKMFKVLLCCLCHLLPLAAQATPIRIKDLVEFDGVRSNDLVGYGLVVGLNGTGDGLRNSPFTEEILSNILERLGVNVTGEQFRPKNVAAVLVTASLPPFARAGSPIDVTVSAIGDANSLLGGTLIMTPLNAADGDTVLDLKPLQNGTDIIYRAQVGTGFDGSHLFVVGTSSAGTPIQLTPNDFDRNPNALSGSNDDDADVNDDYVLTNNDSTVIYRADGRVANTIELFSVDIANPAMPTQLNVDLATGNISAFSASADNRWVAYTSNQDNSSTQELFLIDRNAALPNTIKVSNITAPLSIGVITDAEGIKFSPDGNSLYYIARQNSATSPELYRIDLSNGAPAGPGAAVRMNTPLSTTQAVQVDYQISSDNSQVFYRSDQNLLARNDLFAVDVATPGVATQLNPTLTTAVEGVNAFKIGRDPNGTNPDRLVFSADITTPTVNELYLVRDLTNPGTAEQISQPLSGPPQEVFNDFIVTNSGNRVIFNVDFRQQSVFELFAVDFDFIDEQFRISETMELTGNNVPDPNNPASVFDGTDVEDFITFP